MSLIRNARVSDASSLSLFAERCFRDAFDSQNSEDDMDEYCLKNFSEDIQKEEIENKDITTLLLEVDGQLAAYTQLFFEAAPACLSSENTGEIRRFYVDPPHHGKGVAQSLMSACLSSISDAGGEVAWLAVWEENVKAIKFYEKFAFRQVGEQSFLLGNDLQTDVIMASNLLNCT